MRSPAIEANTPAKGATTRSRNQAATIAQLLLLAYALCVTSAIVLQDHTGWLPLGLFNNGRQGYDILSDVALGCIVTLDAVFILELARGRETAAGRLGRRLIASFLILEALLYLLDLGLVSRSPTSRLGGPYFEVRSSAGRWVLLRKQGEPSLGYSTASMFGYRFRQVYSLRSRNPRVLFLGDSYTEGSASRQACNYPNAVERTLIGALGRNVQVMNAGVAGYGPLEAATLLRFLQEKGVQFDAVVFNLYLGNDFTDNLPATERRVVAGMIFRFPTSPFLRAFHPLNSRTFRFALVVAGLAGEGARQATTAAGEPHRTQGEVERFSRHFLADMREKLQLNYSVAGPGVATGIVHDAVASMRDDAQHLGVPFVLVVIPDRIERSGDLQAALGMSRWAHSYDLSRLQRWVSAALDSIHIIDATAALSAGEENYSLNGTHLNDLGNVRLGEFVGERLAGTLKSPAFLRTDRGRPTVSISPSVGASGFCSPVPPLR